MHGNVSEWCRDFFVGTLPGGTDPFVETDPNVEDSVLHENPDHECRGGCWDDEANRCRSAYRSRSLAGTRSSRLGFRVVLVPAEK